MPFFRKIIHATDLTDRSRPAFDTACELARQNHAKLIILHVAPRGVVSYLDSLFERDEAETHTLLWNAMRERRPIDEDIDVTQLIEEGDAVTTILHVARETDADLLVIGPSRSGHAPLFWFTASTFDELVHRCPCPLLVAVPPKDLDDVKAATDSDMTEEASQGALPGAAPIPPPHAMSH